MTDIQDPDQRPTDHDESMPHRRIHFVLIEAALWSIPVIMVCAVLAATLH